MKITLRQLKVFLAVEQNLSYTKAADSMFMSQPAVSKQVKQLEEEVGLPLFEKVGKRIYLTQAGEAMAQNARDILQKVAETKQQMLALRGHNYGRLKVAVVSTASSFSIDMLGQFRKAFPQVEFEFEVCNRQALLKSLDENAVDLVIMGLPPETDKYEAELFMQNPMVFIAPSDSDLRGKSVSLQALSKLTFVGREEGSGTRKALESFFQMNQMPLKMDMIFNSNDEIKSAVASGFGLALVSYHTIKEEVKHGRLTILDVENTPIQRDWYLVHHRDKQLSSIAQTFRDFLLANAH